MNASTIATAIAALKAYRNTKGRIEDLGVNQYGNQCRQWHPDESHIATVDAAIADLQALQAGSAAVAVDENGFLPCPFCGSKAEWRNEGIYRWVYCSKNHCYANQRRVVGNAVWTWNQRATRDSAAAPMPVSEWMPVEHELYEYPDGKRGLVYANADGMGRPQLRYYRDADTDTPTETVIILPEHLRLCKRVAAPQPVAMPTPNWENAPAWAMWWAIDADNDAFWYESEPQPRFDHSIPPSNTRYEKDDRDDGAWRQTLQRRPEQDSITGDDK